MHLRPLAALVLLSALVPAQGAPRAETVGPWSLEPPISASLVSGGTGSWGWLNTSNAAIDVNTAFSGAGMVEDGYANASIDTIVEVTFSGAITNAPGADLVILDAQFDAGTYAISTEFDGFVAETTVAPTTLADNRDYWYELNIAGSPFYADIYGAEIDLTAVGVPPGGGVTRVRFRCVDNGCDPIGIGSLGPASFALSVNNLVAGRQATLSVSAATPGGLVGIGWSISGGGPTSANAGPCGAVTVDLSNPIRVLPLLTANASGSASVTANVPAGTTGISVWFHALDVGSCTLSNAIMQNIG